MEVGLFNMMILVTYDINTTSKSGASRLRKVAKKCQNYGVRVQNSVFECVVDTTQYTVLKHELLKIIDSVQDSLRFYRLGEKYATKVEHFGIKFALRVEEPLVL